MHYSPELNNVVLFGGRNDSLGQPNKCIFNDIWLLKLNLLQWTKVQSYGEIPDRRYSFTSCLNGTQLIIFGGLNGKTYNSAGVYVCEMDHMKALKLISSNGKKKAYFEDSPIDREFSKLNKKMKKQADTMNMLQAIGHGRSPVKLTRIQELEKQLKEGTERNNLSQFQQKILEDELKTEIINEKCKMIENTETLSELSRTIGIFGVIF